MDIFDEILPSRGKAAAGSVQGDIFDEILPSRSAAAAPAPETPEGLKPTSIGNELLRMGSNLVKGVGPGLKQAFLPQYDAPNAFDKAVGSTGIISPESSQKYLSTPVSQIAGLAQAVWGGAGNVIGGEAEILNQRLRNAMGLEQSPEGDKLVNLAGQAMTPGGAANLPLKAGIAGVKATFNPARKSIQAAGKEGMENSIVNVSKTRDAEAASATATEAAGKAEAKRLADIAAAEAKRAAAHQNLARSTAELDTATSNVAQRQGIPVTSPFGASLAAPITNKEAFSFIQAVKPGSVPNIPLTHLQKSAEDIVAQFEGIPKPLLPGKPLKTAQALSGADEAIQILPDGTPAADLTAAQKSAWAPLLKTIQSHNDVGGLSIDKLQQFKASIGEMTQITGSATLGRRLYRGLMDDLREAAKTNPGAALALKANTTASQNLAAADIADAVTFNGTLVDKFGRLRIQSNTLRKKLDSDELLKQLPETKRKEVTDTLEEIFRANKRVAVAEEGMKTAEKGVKAAAAVRQARAPKPAKLPDDLPEIISPKAPKAGFVARNIGRAAGATLGGGAASMSGIPFSGYAGAYAGAKIGAQAPDKMHEWIFQAALRPGGTQFLKTLFADLPPMAGDVGKMVAIQNFLMQDQ